MFSVVIKDLIVKDLTAKAKDLMAEAKVKASVLANE